jgi:hypothetical protein
MIKHLYIIGIFDSPLCRCVAEYTSAHNLYECEALVSLRHTYLLCFFFDPEDVRSLGTVLNLVKEQGFHNLDIRLWGTKGVSALRPKGLEYIYYYEVYSNIYRNFKSDLMKNVGQLIRPPYLSYIVLVVQ